MASAFATSSAFSSVSEVRWRRRASRGRPAARGRGSPRCARRSTRPAPKRCATTRFSAHRQRVHRLRDLERAADAAARARIRRLAAKSAPSKRTRPALRLDRAGNDVEQRRLAGAVRPDQADDLAVGDGKRHAVERLRGRRSARRCREAQASLAAAAHRAARAGALREQRQQALGREQDHRAEQRAQHDLVADRHERLEHQLVDQIDDDRAHERAGDRAVAAEDRGDDRQHRPQSGERVVGLEEVDVVRVERAHDAGHECGQEQHQRLQQRAVDADGARRLLAVVHRAQRQAVVAVADPRIDRARTRAPASARSSRRRSCSRNRCRTRRESAGCCRCRRRRW